MTISPINLGNSFTSTGGGSVLSGLSSGLNTQSVITSLVASQSSQITKLNDQVTVNNGQLSALSTLQQLLTEVQSSVSILSDPQAPDPTANVFAALTTNITSNTSQAASNFLSVSASSTAAAGSYAISNIALASATTQQTSAFAVNPATTPLVVASGAVGGQFNAGTFTIASPTGGSSASVTFNAGDTLNQIAADFNAVNGTTNLTASVQTTSAGVYTLAFTNTTTSAPVSFDLTSATNITSDPSNVLAEQTTPTYTLSAATNPFVVASGATSGQFNAGSFTLTGPGGSGTVTLKTGDTLGDVAADFNAVKATTGISASLLQTSPGAYTLVFSSSTTGQSTLFDMTNANKPGTVANDVSGALSQITFQPDSPGQDASFDFNGTTITRSTNSVSDLIPGVTFSLLQGTSSQPGANFTVQVSPDTTTIEDAINNFATAYNNFLTFYSQQTALNSSGTPASSAILYSDTTLQNIYSQVTSEAASIVSGLSNNSPSGLTDIGISFFNAPATSSAPAVNNELSIDSTTLEAALQTNLSGVENVFGYNLTSSSPNLASFSSATNSDISGFTLTISNGIYTATPTQPPGPAITLTASPLGTGGVSLAAPSGSDLVGLVLIYTGNGSDSPITVTTTQGIASQINNFVSAALAANSGLIASDQQAINTRNTSLQTQITSVTTQVSNQRQELLQKYSDLEAAISEANSSLDLLNAQQQASSSSSG